MTTDRWRIRRESVHDWPIFSDVDAPHVEVLSIELSRHADESVASATAISAEVLLSALRHVVTADQRKLALVATRMPVAKSGKVAAFHAERDRLWVALEKLGRVLPDGDRSESQISRTSDELRFGGCIEFAVPELAIALEVTRLEDAVCLGPHGSNDVTQCGDLLVQAGHETLDASSLLRITIPLIARGLFVARSFGQFDDVTVGSEVFADSGFLDRLESAISAV